MGQANSAEHPTPPLAKLRRLGAGRRLQNIELTQQGLSIGSDLRHRLVLGAEGILPFHAEILWQNSGFVIQAKSAAAEVWVNQVQIVAPHGYPLQDGDLIQLGPVTFEFQRLGDRSPREKRLTDSRLPGTLVAPNYAPTILQVNGPQWTQDFPLQGDQIYLGCDRTCDIVVTEPGVADRHLLLTREGATYRVKNLQAPQTLQHQRDPVQDLRLQDGMTLSIPPAVTLIYQVLPSVDPIEREESLDLKNRVQLTLGRDPHNQTVLDHPLVSRFHAEIYLKDGDWQVQDLHSSNGTFVNNERIVQPRQLRPGDTIRVGPYQFSFNFDETLVQQDDTGNLRLDALKLRQSVGNKLQILDEVSLAILPREFVAIVGVSGAGKSTLLNALNGYQPASQGRVCVNGQDLYKNFNAYRMELGYVPQDDIIHQDLQVIQALDFAARLRLPADVSRQERSRQVQAVLKDLELHHRQTVPVKQLSGGQRKRVSIGVELLTQPSLFFLDEATSGLDPGTETQMMRLLRRLADQGRTVVLVTHATKNVMLCDKVVFLAKGGRVAFYGPPAEALDYFGVQDFDEIYLKIEEESTPEQWKQRFLRSDPYQRHIRDRQQNLEDQLSHRTQAKSWLKLPSANSKSGLRQWWILSQRNLTLLLQDKASLLVILAIAPLLGLLDFAMWRKDLFDPAQGDPAQSFTILFVSVLIAVIVGSLATMREIVKEAEIYRRERMIGLQIFPYIFSKLWLCVVLALYEALIFLITKLISVDFPISGTEGFGLYLTLFLATLGGMVMGLLVSSLSPNQSVAPLLTILFLVPQITFAGSILPLRMLGPVGHALSQVTVSRWAFEAMVTLSNVGEAVAEDPCWQTPESVRETWSDQQKTDCRCLGANLFKSCRFPGLWKQYDPAVDQPEPPKPEDPGSPPPVPETAQVLLSGSYAEQVEDYSNRVDRYQTQLDRWQEDFRLWKENRGKAIASAEELLERSYRNQGQSYQISVWGHWLRLLALMVGMIGLLAWNQKRKDTL